TSDGCLVEYTLRPASVPRYISDDNSDVLVYPNPVSSGGKLSIDIKNENYTITGAELLDLTSNIIQRYETTPGGRQSINLAGIAPGVYFLKLSTNKGIIVKKLVVM
ncbi:MAG: T9SS type A sorting domain-containing protein, partial [Bacteroidota bacterium]